MEPSPPETNENETNGMEPINGFNTKKQIFG